MYDAYTNADTSLPATIMVMYTCTLTHVLYVCTYVSIYVCMYVCVCMYAAQMLLYTVTYIRMLKPAHMDERREGGKEGRREGGKEGRREGENMRVQD